jgi:cobalt-zinc-cadmium efflux system protein
VNEHRHADSGGSNGSGSGGGRATAAVEGHGHGHGIPTGSGGRRRLTIVLGISSTILIVEIIGAVVSGSLALLADAGHMLTDVAGLSLAVAAAVLATRPTTPERTWGFLRAEVLAAAEQAAVLLAVGGFVLVEGVRRLFAPPVWGSRTWHTPLTSGDRRSPAVGHDRRRVAAAVIPDL